MKLDDTGDAVLLSGPITTASPPTASSPIYTVFLPSSPVSNTLDRLIRFPWADFDSDGVDDYLGVSVSGSAGEVVSVSYGPVTQPVDVVISNPEPEGCFAVSGATPGDWNDDGYLDLQVRDDSGSLRIFYGSGQ